ncbi:uncharacterized protein K02A2.6-like [Ornithodoros turicata]|uniref:uncharacterized protein K02A2.6-like n=1 Tax=Ornithodoros turicata TaxID=34597 RepID=UPI0031397183
MRSDKTRLVAVRLVFRLLLFTMSLATTASFAGLAPPPVFLEKPGKPDIPWGQWRRRFELFLCASGAQDLPAEQRKAILLHSVGTEGQRIYFSLPEVVPALQLSGSAASEASEDETAKKPTSAKSKQNVYDIAMATLDAHYVHAPNVIAEQHRFRQRKQRPGESIHDFVTDLRILVIHCDFGMLQDDMVRDQIVAGTVIPGLRERLLSEGSRLTVERAIEVGRNMERTFAEARDMTEMTEDNQQVYRIAKDKESAHVKSKQRTSKHLKTEMKCYRCGSKAHLANDSVCRAKRQTCRACGKTGHFAKMCRSAGDVRVVSHQVEYPPRLPDSRQVARYECGHATNAGFQDAMVPKLTEPQDESPMVLQLDSSRAQRIRVMLQVEGRDVEALVDTGSSVSIMNNEVYQHFATQHPLTSTSVRLLDFSRQCIPIEGFFVAEVAYAEHSSRIVFYVVNTGATLLGLDGIAALQLRIEGQSLRCLQTSVAPPVMSKELQQEFQHLFTDGLGLARGYIHKVKLCDNVKPVQAKLRRLPFSVRDEVSRELQRLLDDDVVERVDASEWVSPIVVAKKKNGTIRLCVDLRAPNQAVIADCFPLPSIDELMVSLVGAKWFSKLDLKSAYHQVLLSEDSRDLTAFITHEGLFRFKRVCFGLASAPSAFQKMMTNVLKGCSGVLCYLDDVVVFGGTREEHHRNLRAVLSRISAVGLKLNNKCVFDVPELSFVGHLVNAQGILPLQSNVDAVLRLPAPKDFSSLRSFLGLVGFYAKFIQNFADEAEPLRRILRGKSAFAWDEAAERSFTRIKKILSSKPTLSVFNPRLPVVVTTDASGQGLGAVLQQVDGDDINTVAFASRTLSAAERKYSASEREALAAVWACERWHLYLWGRKFTLRTDHQALVSLLTTQGSGHRPCRIVRWASRLLRYSFVVEYKKGSDNFIADALSRLPIQDEMEAEEDICLITAPIEKQELQQESTKDLELQQVSSLIEEGWPERKSAVSDELKPFWNVRNELSLVDSMLMRGERIIPPKVLRHQLLELAHEAHQGMVRCKQRLRDIYWWPRMDADVEAIIRACGICQRVDKSAKTVRAPLCPVLLPDGPWEKIAIDVVGPIESAPLSCRFAITLIDYFSRWPEVCFANTVTASTVRYFVPAKCF